MTKSRQVAHGDWYSKPEPHPFGSDTGYQVVIGHAASLQRTSVRTNFMTALGEERGLKAEHFGHMDLANLRATRVDGDINYALTAAKQRHTRVSHVARPSRERAPGDTDMVDL